MKEGLIESIKNAEKAAVELKAQAEKKAEQRLMEVRESHKKSLHEVEKSFKAEKNRIRNRALEKAENNIEKKRNEMSSHIQSIIKKGEEQKEQAVMYLINKILE